MRREEFEYFANLVKQQAGYVIAPDKAYVLESRLARLAQRNKCADPGELVDLVRRSPDGEVAPEPGIPTSVQNSAIRKHEVESCHCTTLT